MKGRMPPRVVERATVQTGCRAVMRHYRYSTEGCNRSPSQLRQRTVFEPLHPGRLNRTNSEPEELATRQESSFSVVAFDAKNFGWSNNCQATTRHQRD